jgi:hypothetical protein
LILVGLRKPAQAEGLILVRLRIPAQCEGLTLVRIPAQGEGLLFQEDQRLRTKDTKCFIGRIFPPLRKWKG